MRNFFALLGLLIIQLNGFSQDPYYSVINTETGLPSNSIYDIFQDKRGFLWITSDDGLCRYDGYEFKRYNNEAQNSNSGSCIKQDMYGRIWYENFDGNLLFVENDTLKIFQQKKSIGYYQFAIIKDKIYVVAHKRVDIYDLEKFNLIKSINFNHPIIYSIQSNNYYYVISNNKIFSIDGNGSIKKITNEEKINGILCENSTGIIHVNRESKDKIILQFNHNGLLKENVVRNINYILSLSHTDSILWLSTKKGVYCINENGTMLGKTPYFANYNVSKVIKDKEGSYWVSTLEDGLLYLPSLQISQHNNKFHPTSIVANDSASFYLGSNNNSIFYINQSFNYKELNIVQEKNHKIYYLNYDHSKKILFYTGSDFNAISIPLNKKIIGGIKVSIKDICKLDEKYYAYAATGSAGLFSLDSKKLVSEWDSLYNSSTKLEPWNKAVGVILSTRVRSVTYNKSSKSIYYCTGLGLYKVTKLKKQEILHNKKSLYLSYLRYYKSNLYGLDMQKNIVIINNNNQVKYIQEESIKAKEIKLIRLLNNYLFIVASNGIFYCDLDKGISEFNTIILNLNNLDIMDLNISNRKLYLISNKGLLEVDYTKIKKPLSFPSLVINEFKVNNNSISLKNVRDFKYNENSIEINYSVLSFKYGSNLPVYYKIGSNVWQLANSNSRTIRLINLSSGKYSIRFHLGELSENLTPDKEINFIIKQPFWFSYWFLGFISATIVLLSYLFYQNKVNTILRQNKLLKDNFELEQNTYKYALSSIRSQMNPHFFFNALNTIQYFIFSNDKHNASIFLSKISMLTRMILEMSTAERVSIHKEILALTLYLELEKERFNKDFNFKIITAQSINTETVEIPSMLIQPFVENAVKHGLLHKKGEKFLSVSFFIVDQKINVIIEDNGIGRIRAYELNKTISHKHPSFSTEATKKRVDLLNKVYENISINIIDLYDDNKNPKGTKVILSILENKKYEN